jgi:hypothetical protein
VRSDDNIKFRKRDEGDLSDFGESKPTNSFSGGETDHLFLSDVGEQFYDLDMLSGLAHPGDGRTACQLDYDRDGWNDFVVASANAPTVQLYRNRIGERFHPDAKGSRMVALRFVGGNRTTAASTEWSPRAGYGALVNLNIGGKPLVREVRCGDGRAAVHSRTMLVGVGDNKLIREIHVRWPSGKEHSWKNVPAGRLVTVYENPDESPNKKPFHTQPYLKNVLKGAKLAQAEKKHLPLTLPHDDSPAALNLVTAMSTHCKGCQRLQPQVALLRETFDRSLVGIWGVGTDLDESPETLEAYSGAHQPAYLVLSDLAMEERRALREHVRDTFQDDLTPATVITDASGGILRTLTGIPTVSEVLELLDSVQGR